MPKPEFKATVEISREWNGEKVAEELVHKLKSKTPNPKFILLFTTIHYQNEFKPILSGLKDAFPDSPLIGGTVAGFITPEGCFTRGVTCLAVDYPDMDVAVGVGHDAKKDYKQAVDSALFELNKKKSKLPSRFIIEILPSATIPSFPGIGQKNVILSEKIGDRAVSLIPLATKFNFGSDRADEILERLSSKTSEVIIGGCTMDDNKLIRSYQFCDNKIFNSELCLLKFFTTMKARLFTMFGFQPMKKEFLITKIDENKRIVSEINHEKARTAFLNMLGWKESDLGQLYQLYRRIFYYPFGYKRNKYWHACMIGLIWGQHLIFANKIKDKRLQLLSLSGYRFMKNFEQTISKINFDKTKLIFGIACETLIETLGNSIYKIKDILSRKVAEKPFLILFMAGESVRNIDNIPHHFYESLNLLTLE